MFSLVSSISVRIKLLLGLKNSSTSKVSPLQGMMYLIFSIVLPKPSRSNTFASLSGIAVYHSNGVVPFSLPTPLMVRLAFLSDIRIIIVHQDSRKDSLTGCDDKI